MVTSWLKRVNSREEEGELMGSSPGERESSFSTGETDPLKVTLIHTDKNHENKWGILVLWGSINQLGRRDIPE